MEYLREYSVNALIIRPLLSRLAFLFFFAFPTLIVGQVEDSTDLSGAFTSSFRHSKPAESQVTYSGFYRFLGFVRAQNEVFPNNSGKTTVISVGDFFREPMLKLRLNGLTNERISWGVDFMVNSIYKGPAAEKMLPLDLELGLNFRSTFKTSHGLFTIRSGGVSWYRQSRLTVWGNQTFNRSSIYHRRPQTPMGRYSSDRYVQFYENGLIDQGERYGSRAFQGLFLSAQKLPRGFSAKGVIGKSNFNRSFPPTNDNFTGCFQIGKKAFGNGSVAYNFLISSGDIDSVSVLNRKYSIHSLDFRKQWDSFSIEFEGGVGEYVSPDFDLGIGEAITLMLKTSSKWPLILQAYRISPQFVNVTGNMLNTSVMEVFPDVAGVGATIRAPYKSPMVGMGFPTNNRQGISLNADIDLGKLKINGGIGVYTEIDTSSSDLSYIHNVNGETISRMYIFQQAWGPYNALNTTYRRTFEEVSIQTANANGMADFKKYFNTVEVQMKYSDELLGRRYHIFSLTRINACRDDFRWVPELNLNSILTQMSQEIDFSLQLTKNVIAVASFGIERVIGNDQTDLGDSYAPSPTNVFFDWIGYEKRVENNYARNQRNRLFGVGIDYQISSNVGFFLRHNLYRFYDPNFIENHLEGTETMLELKVTF